MLNGMRLKNKKTITQSVWVTTLMLNLVGTSLVDAVNAVLKTCGLITCTMDAMRAGRGLPKVTGK